MFSNATNFNGFIGNWDLTNCINMSYCFEYSNFNNNNDEIRWGKLNNLKYMKYTFSNCPFNQKISKFGGNKLFYDVIYNPSETNFLKKGKKLGNKVENGKMMFLYQAFEAFKLWHDIEPEINDNTLKLLQND